MSVKQAGELEPGDKFMWFDRFVTVVEVTERFTQGRSKRQKILVTFNDDAEGIVRANVRYYADEAVQVQ